MDPDRVSSYLGYLPAVLRQGADGQPPFLGRFLLAFEAVLSGLPAAELPAGAGPRASLEQVIEGIDRLFDPVRTDPEFLPWLAQWVAASLRDDWSEQTRRQFLANVVPLYRERGTRAGIEKMLQLSGDEARVVDFFDGLDDELEWQLFGQQKTQAEFRASIPPHFFGVIVTVRERDEVLLARRTRRVRAIVDRERPAHTYYGLRILYPALQINDDPKAHPDFGPGLLLKNDKPLVLGTTTKLT